MRGWMTVLALCAQGCDHGFHDEGDPDPLLDYDPPSDLSTPSQLDVLPQSAQAKLDVLWVIDASGSMAEERPKLLAALPSFMDDLLGSGFDWHVGVVTMGEGPSRPLGALVLSGGAAYLTPDTPDPVGALSQMAAEDDTAGPGGQGFLAALDALTMPTPELLARNGGFLRDSAELRVIVVSDQDDQSAPAVTRDQFVAAMQVLKPDPSTPVSFSAITGDAPGGCDAANSGAAYVAAADALDGAVGSVCDEDWTASMPSVAVQDGVFNTEFFLTQVPVPGTLSVWVTDGDLRYDGLDVAALAADGWSVAEACAQGLTNCFPYRYDLVRNVVVTSGFVPAPSTRVHARYDLLSTPE